MDLTQASLLANKVLIALHPFCEGLKVAGSIRREKPEVHDIDIVAMPKVVMSSTAFGFPAPCSADNVWTLLIPFELHKLGLKREISGPELIRCSFPDGFQVDIYRARPETWGIILLVRTGSKEHNMKLCALAKSKGLKFSVSRGIVAFWINARRTPRSVRQSYRQPL